LPEISYIDKKGGKMKVLILTDELNKKALSFKENLLSLLEERRVKTVSRAKLADLILVLGGDGWMIRCIHRHYKALKPFLGINFGYKGFFMNDLRDELVDLIIGGKYNLFTFPFLETASEVRGGRVFKTLALNDIYFNRSTRQSCRLNVKVDDIVVAEKIQGDGLVVCTSLGSTGYNLAAGGSSVHPEISAIGLTPLAIHTPVQFKPMVFPLDSKILVEVLEPKKRRVQLAADIIEYKNVLRAEIKKSEFSFRLALLEGESFTKRIIEKIMRVSEN